MISAERISTSELCPRRAAWQDRYQLNRISVVAALYRALDAGLRGKDPERSAESEFMGLAAHPGLDVLGRDIYGLAMHHAKLAGIIAVALRSAFAGPWKAVGDSDIGLPTLGAVSWRSGLYDAGNGIPRRVVLVDRWSDDRKAAELRSWRTLGEVCALNRPVLVTAVTIGASKDGKRHSAWTKCYQHPKNRTYRFKRKNAAEDFGSNWEPIWRENSEIPTAAWLARMQHDDCMVDVVQTVEAGVPKRREAFLAEMRRATEEMRQPAEEIPPMRLAGCYGFTPCPFLAVCFGTGEPIPENYNFRRKPSGDRANLLQIGVTLPAQGTLVVK